MNWKILLLTAVLMSQHTFADDVKIITVDSPQAAVLRQKTTPIQEDELPLAQEIADKLFSAITPYLPSAGLAAPQIGISKSIFIFSFDRDPKNLEVAINPTFIPLDDTTLESWEGCLSTIVGDSSWQLAKLHRYERICVRYLNLQGKVVEKTLEGFGAKVFQHEYDHLEGIVNIDRKDALVKAFPSREDLFAFIAEVKKQDALRYNKPN